MRVFDIVNAFIAEGASYGEGVIQKDHILISMPFGLKLTRMAISISFIFFATTLVGQPQDLTRTLAFFFTEEQLILFIVLDLKEEVTEDKMGLGTGREYTVRHAHF